MAGSDGDKKTDDYVAALERAPVPIYVHQDELVQFANRATFSLMASLGYRLEPSAIGTLNVYDFMPPDQRGPARARASRILRHGTAIVHQPRLIFDARGRNVLIYGCAGRISWSHAPAIEVVLTWVGPVWNTPEGPAHSVPRARTSRGRALQRLTPREIEVAQALSMGLSTSNVAARLGIGEATVCSHLKQVHRKLGVHCRADLTRLMTQLERRR